MNTSASFSAVSMSSTKVSGFHHQFGSSPTSPRGSWTQTTPFSERGPRVRSTRSRLFDVASTGPSVSMTCGTHTQDVLPARGPMIQVWTHSQERSEEHTSELQSRFELVCRRLLEKKNRRNAACAELRL